MPEPLVTDDVETWFSPRLASTLRSADIKTLADLTVRVPRRRRWWVVVPGLGQTSARSVEAFFASYPQLTERARALIPSPQPLARPWEALVVPADVDGSRGRFRAPRESCALAANNDYAAIQAWLELHESSATQRAYRKEAERLVLWAILDRGKPLSSLTTEDAVAYRAFLRRPVPASMWVGPARPRHSHEWRPFQGALAARSIAYALSVIGALFRWLIEQRYVLANPFSGIKVQGAKRAAAIDANRGFGESEWRHVRSIADGLEHSAGWSEEAAMRLRFLLDFWYATGLRPHEMVSLRLGHIQRDGRGDDWIKVVGKGAKEGEVALPLSALGALERYLAFQRRPVTRSRWDPAGPVIPNLDGEGGVTAARVWAVMKRFFMLAADTVQGSNPSLADQLRKATPHWMRHTHASHALARGAELTSVRDNLRHASISTTSVYLHGDRGKRARQMREAFSVEVCEASQR
jgi:site-specific recombinase XerD